MLAPISLPITLKRCIKWVAATRDFYEVHHDADFARAAGEPDLFIGVHFAHLQAATAERKVILAGRTMEPGDKTFGLVVFEATDEAAARAFMNSDPAVTGKIMTAELHPFGVALMRK